MKALRITSLFAGLMSIASSAFASGGRVDNSGFVVWAFLGFCALIVVAQLVPALLVMLGVVKGVASSKDAALQETTK